MERKGVVGASERNPWKKPDEPLDDYVDVFARYEDGYTGKTFKVGGKFCCEELFGPVLYWMRIPPLPKE